MQERLFKRWKS